MYPAAVEYQRAESIDDALAQLAAAADQDVRLLAGGHGLVPAMKASDAQPDVLVDISSIDALRSIDIDDQEVSVGAVVTHAAVADSDVLAEHAALLAATAREVGDLQVRNRGTIGGNLAEADPTADLPAAALALEATLHATGPDGDRSIPVVEFFAGEGRTALAVDELLTHLTVPVTTGPATYLKKTHPATGYAMVGVAVVLATDGGTIREARIGLTGVATRAVRLPAVEAALADVAVDDPEGIEAAAERAATDLDGVELTGDAYASGEFRAALVPPYVRRAVTQALETGGDRS